MTYRFVVPLIEKQIPNEQVATIGENYALPSLSKFQNNGAHFGTMKCTLEKQRELQNNKAHFGKTKHTSEKQGPSVS